MFASQIKEIVLSSIAMFIEMNNNSTTTNFMGLPIPSKDDIYLSNNLPLRQIARNALKFSCIVTWAIDKIGADDARILSDLNSGNIDDVLSALSTKLFATPSTFGTNWKNMMEQIHPGVGASLRQVLEANNGVDLTNLINFIVQLLDSATYNTTINNWLRPGGTVNNSDMYIAGFAELIDNSAVQLSSMTTVFQNLQQDVTDLQSEFADVLAAFTDLQIIVTGFDNTLALHSEYIEALEAEVHALTAWKLLTEETLLSLQRQIDNQNEFSALEISFSRLFAFAIGFAVGYAIFGMSVFTIILGFLSFIILKISL